MRGIRRKEKEIKDEALLKKILQTAEHVTIAMCAENQPYLVTLSHGYDAEKNCVYFHCASKGKKMDILKENNVVWGQAMIDKGYVQGECDHLYATTQFKGKVEFLETLDEKKEALKNMIYRIDNNPEAVIKNQITEESVTRITIGRIDIEYMSGKEAKEAIISM